MKKLLTTLMLLCATTMTQAKTAIVYFSVPEYSQPADVDGVTGASVIVKDQQVLGATQYLAELIQAKTQADIFRLETVKNYPTEHSVLLDIGQEQQRKNIKPALKSVPNMQDYDTVFLGFPLWWYKLPMAVQNFVEQVDLSGKKVVLFVTSGGTGFSNTTKQMKQLQPKATIVEGFHHNMYRTTRPTAIIENALNKRLTELGF